MKASLAISTVALALVLLVSGAAAGIDERGDRQNVFPGDPYVVEFFVAESDVELPLRVQVGVRAGPHINVYVLSEQAKADYDAGRPFAALPGATWWEVRDVNEDIALVAAGTHYLVVDNDGDDGRPRGGSSIIHFVLFAEPIDRGIPGPTLLPAALVLVGLARLPQ